MDKSITYNKWLPYHLGDYEKVECDVRSHHGLIYRHCWPNAGKFQEMCGERRSVGENYIAEIMYVQYYENDSCETCKNNREDIKA